MFEEIFSLYLASPVVQLGCIALGRTILGYLENVVNKKVAFSWRVLGETVFRIIPQAFGLSAFGVPPEAALMTDWLVTKVSNALKAQKK